MWALVFPASYAVGVANLGMHLVAYGLQNLGVGVERFFLSSPPFLSLESARSLQNFPVITASIAYEGDVLPFFRMLKASGIPLSWKSREAQRYPLVGVGGALCSLNPALFHAVADFVLVGDAEPELPSLVGKIRAFHRHGDRHRLWHDLANSAAMLIPPLDTPEESIRRSVCRNLDDFLGHSVWMSPQGVFGETFLVELQRGCRRGCPYCTLPSCFTPLRTRSLDSVLSMLEKTDGRVTQVGLVTPEAGDYPALELLLKELRNRHLRVSFASLRVDALTETMLEVLTESQRSSITIAPETSERLRYRCGKPFSDALILEKLRMARSLGIRKTKMYCMTGLPGEQEEDLDALAQLVARIVKDVGLDVVVGANTFVPKPGSPWAQEAFIGAEEGRRRLRKLEHYLENQGMPRSRWTLRAASAREAALEYALTWANAQDSVSLAEAVDMGATPEDLLLQKTPDARTRRQKPFPPSASIEEQGLFRRREVGNDE